MHFYIGRFILGLSAGAVVTCFPMYVGEISDDNIRGTLGAVRSIFGCTSALIVCATGSIISIQTMAIVGLIIPVLVTFGFFWLPESPMYLMRTGKTKEAMDAMLWLRGGNKEVAEEEIAKLTVVIEESKANQLSLKDLISARGTRCGLIICIVLAAAQQLSGITPIMSYCVSLFQSAGGSVSPITASIIAHAVQLAGAIITSILLDIAGRRLLLIFSQVLMIISLVTLGTYFFLQKQEFDISHLGYLPLACVAVYVLCVAVGLGSVPYVIMAEIFNPHARGIASSITVGTMWIFGFMTSKFYPDMVTLLDLHGCYWMFALVCVACLIFTIFKIPETKNRSLESILKELSGGNDEKHEENIKKSGGE
ncbi:hypothetical protein L9F63_026728, partial [Diploptera punctata]